jgi:hypothetical protein
MTTPRLLLLALVALAVTGCGRGELREYVSPEGRFKALLFPNVKEEERLVGNAFSYGAISVAYQDGKVPATPKEAEERLDLECHRILSNLSATLLAETKQTLAGKYPGRAVAAGLVKDRKAWADYRARLYLVGGRLYIVQAIGASWFVQSDEVKDFLESFEVIP